MDLATLQHILTERGLPGIARRAQQHHADKWASIFVTDDHKAEFNGLIDLAIKVVSMRKIFADGDAIMEGMLEAENLDRLAKAHMKTIGTSQAEAVANTKPKIRPKSDFNLGVAEISIDGSFWTRNLDKMFWYGQDKYMATAMDEPCDTDSSTDFKGVSLSFQQMQDFKCPDGMCKNVHFDTFCHIVVFRLHSGNVPALRWRKGMDSEQGNHEWPFEWLPPDGR